VRCPECGQADLGVEDVPWERDKTYIERHLVCPACGAQNAVRMRA
jgi:transcriptional regulator NrdR family protein